MKIEDVIAAINQMEVDGVIGQYAIGGAVGATFYLEPIDTVDVDVFVALKLASGESIVVSGWPVQFLPVATPLLEEALRESIERFVDERTHVFTAEHLAAIALQRGRGKDKARLLQFVESGVLDATRFDAILNRHGLVDVWPRFERQFCRDV